MSGEKNVTIEYNRLTSTITIKNNVFKDFEELEKLLDEISEWENLNHASKRSTQIKFVEMETRNRTKTIDLVYNEHGQLDVESLQVKIESCNDEFIKIRIPNDVDTANFITCIQNDTSECRRRERAKTITEYFV